MLQNENGPKKEKIPPTADFKPQVFQCLVRAALIYLPGFFPLNLKYLFYSVFTVYLYRI